MTVPAGFHYERVSPDAVTACDLIDEMEAGHGEDVAAARVKFLSEEGLALGEPAELLYFPSERRAEIAWDYSTLRLQADSIEDALRRYLERRAEVFRRRR